MFVQSLTRLFKTTDTCSDDEQLTEKYWNIQGCVRLAAEYGMARITLDQLPVVIKKLLSEILVQNHNPCKR